MRTLEWTEDTDPVAFKRHGIRSFVAHVSPLLRMLVIGNGPEESATWHACKSEGAVIRRLGYLRPVVPVTFEGAQKKCLGYLNQIGGDAT